MKVLITGGAGYIGSHLVNELLSLGADCVVLDNLSRGLEKRLNSKVEFAKIDLCDVAKLNKFMRGNAFDTIFHLAGYMQARESSRIPNEYWENNLVATQNLLHSLRDPNYTKFIFSSSCSVYGNNSLAIESSELNPLSVYALTKVEAEVEILRKYKSAKENVTLFRFFNVVGCSPLPYFCDIQQETLLPSAARLLLQGHSPVIYGNDFQTSDGFAVRDFIDVRDLVRALILPLNSELFGVHNLSSGHSRSIYSVVQQLIDSSKLHGVRIKIANRNSEDPSFIQSKVSTKLLGLNWEPKHQLKDSIDNFWSVFSTYFVQEDTQNR